MAQVDVTITNRDTGKFITLRACSGWQFTREQPAISVPIINAKPENNILFRFTGQQDTVTFQFLIFDNGVRVNNALDPTPVITKAQQLAYLRDEIYTEDYDVDWTLQNTDYFPVPVRGIITNLEINSEAGSPTRAVGSITFMRGRIGAM